MTGRPCGSITPFHIPPMKEFTKEDLLRSEIRHNHLKLFFGTGNRSSFSSLSPREAKEKFDEVPSSEKDSAFREWLSVCRTTREAEEAFHYTSRDDRGDWAFQRWLELCSSTRQAEEAFDATSRDHRLNWAFKRWLTLCSTESEAREAYHKTSNSQREEWARERIRELGGDI